MNRPATLLELKAYFETSSSQFAKEWKELSDEDKTELKSLLGALHNLTQEESK